MNYHFQWDPIKAASNRRKHGVSFDDAVTVFRDPRARSLFDDGHSVDDERWITLGISDKAGVLVVHHTYEEMDADNLLIRIISSRKATKREISQYPEP
jgi:uncharacterized protein